MLLFMKFAYEARNKAPEGMVLWLRKDELRLLAQFPTLAQY